VESSEQRPIRWWHVPLMIIGHGLTWTLIGVLLSRAFGCTT